MYKNGIFFVLDVFDFACLWWKGSFLIFKAWLIDRKNTKYAKTLMIGCVKPKWGWSMAFSRVMAMKNTLMFSHLTCPSAPSSKKNIYKKWKIKNDYMSASKICILIFSSLFISGNEKNPGRPKKDKSSRHLEIAATSIFINTLLLNQRKKGTMTQKPLRYAFSRAKDWRLTDWRVNDGISEATDDRKWRYVVKWKVILCIIN